MYGYGITPELWYWDVMLCAYEFSCLKGLSIGERTHVVGQGLAVLMVE